MKEPGTKGHLATTASRVLVKMLHELLPGDVYDPGHMDVMYRVVAALGDVEAEPAELGRETLLAAILRAIDDLPAETIESRDGNHAIALVMRAIDEAAAPAAASAGVDNRPDND